MDLMTRRRALLARMESEPGIDTSPRIAEYGVYLSQGGLHSPNSTDCITEVYHFSASNTARNLYSYGLTPYMITYKDGGQTYMDWWSVNTRNTPGQTGKLNANSDGVAFSLIQSALNDCYVYIVESGDILFAGRDSIYYGHRNINELN